MRSLALWIGSPLLVSAGFWTGFAASTASPVPVTPPAARIVALWDPLQCGADPYRVVVDLDDAGGPLVASAPCTLGGLTLDVPHLGSYRGRIYAWTTGAPIRSVSPVEVAVADPIVRWPLVTPL